MTYGRGVIVLDQGHPVVGATVSLNVNGTHTTGADGAAVLQFTTTATQAELIVQATGYLRYTQTVPLGNQVNQNWCIGFQGAASDVSLPPLVPAVPVPATLTVQGLHLIDQTGNIWFWKGCTDFGLYAKYLAGEDLGPLLDYRRDLGANTVRVLSMKYGPYGNYFDLNPHDHADYYAKLPAFAMLVASHGLRLDWCVLADCGPLGFDVSAQQTHLDQCAAAFMGHANVSITAGNEWAVNDWDPGSLRRPAFSGLFSWGAPSGGDNPWIGNQDLARIHMGRDAKWVRNVSKVSEDVIQGFPGYAGVQVPLEHEEDMGAAESSRGDRRSSPLEFFKWGIMVALWGATDSYGCGGTFHSDDGLRSAYPFGPVQESCARAAFKGIDLIQQHLV